MNFKDLLSPKRIGDTTLPGRNLTEELASDKSRIVYSAPFRRLSRKAQVFPLESNAAIRNRVTHSLEVADVGRWIAYYVTEKLVENGSLDPKLQLPIMFATENACLLHDIGNPPFGHFGEAAIKDWFIKNWESCYRQSLNSCIIEEDNNIKQHIKDFLEFDGNPQGLRIILRLQRDKDKFGLNLTYTTILAFIKYARSTTEPKDSHLKKKPGYFETERKIVEALKTELSLPVQNRYPLTYIMEAADDIAYCMSDIEDGIEKGIITVQEFFQELEDEWNADKKGSDLEYFPLSIKIESTNIDLRDPEKAREIFFKFKTTYSRNSIQKATDNFLTNQIEIIEGRLPSLFQDDAEEGRAINCIKKVARRKLFRSPEAENPELAGYKIITGLLEALKPLLICSEDEFNRLLEGRNNPSKVSYKGLDLHRRLFNKLPIKHILAYEDQLLELRKEGFHEWHLRAHLIVDFVSGMTDRFALELFQLLNGIRLY